MTFGDGAGTPGRDVEPASDYDRFVDWDKRLAREAPFFAREFAAHEVRSVLDVGCGTGRHALMWAEAGLRVTGADPGEAMLAQARINAEAAAARIAEAGGSVRFVPDGFGALAAAGLGPVDAVTCTGNALPHVGGAEALRAAFEDFAEVLRPGGLLVLHLLNHDRLLGSRPRAIPPVVREDETGTWVFLRVMDYPGDGIGFDFLTMHRGDEGGAWELSSRRSVHTALPTALLTAELERAGFVGVRLLGSHDGTPLHADRDESVIVVATRGPSGG